MTNHVNLILVPKSENALQKAMKKISQRHTRRINFKKGWRGYLWQGRFASTPMDEAHTLQADVMWS
ncbi:hypothetical protein [Magnetococcus marinus]|uniref:hypothetical protein n=1 Tax=Magnetococcus marinus TaxID=1124597 RepID=UPI00387ECA93